MSAIVTYLRLHESYSHGDMKKKIGLLKMEILKLGFLCYYMNLFSDLIHSKSRSHYSSAKL